MLRYIRISIHLMLLFIIINCFLFVQYFHFNTSHVTVYRRLRIRNCNQVHISIHLMLLFICLIQSSRTTATAFQYISCYCLSKIQLLAQGNVEHFNTSHVTVYQEWRAEKAKTFPFQYISCYCLSFKRF